MPQAPTVAIPKTLPLVVRPENRGTTTTMDAKLVNCFVEKGEEEGEFFVLKRVGLLHSSQPSGGAAAGEGLYNWLGDQYSIFGATFYKNGVSKGTVDSTGGVYRFSSCLGATPRLQLGNGIHAYNYDDVNGLVMIPDSTSVVVAGNFIIGHTYTILTIGSTDFTAIGAATNTVGLAFLASGVGSGTGTASPDNFPNPVVKGWAYLDGTTYVMTAKAAIQGSDLNDPTFWDPDNVIIAQIEPDGGVALGKQLVYVIAFKQWTTEIFYDAGNGTGSPLGTVQGAKINYGCVNQDSVRELDGNLFWVGTNRSSSCNVMMMDNLKAEPISTPPIERLLDDADFTTVYAFTFKHQGHKFYVLTIKNNNLTLVYDATTRFWHQWTDANGNYFPFVDSTYNAQLQHFFQHESDGRIYLADTSYLTDAGLLIVCDVYTPNFTGGTSRRKMMKQLRFKGDKTPGSILQVRVSDDDYQSWSNFRQVNMNDNVPQLSDCGTFTKRAHHIRHACNTTFRMSAVELQIDLGTL